MTNLDAIRARLAAATSGLTPGPTRVNWAGSPGWFLPDTLITHLLAELDHADRLCEQQADRIDQLETAGQALAELLEAEERNDGQPFPPDSFGRRALDSWRDATKGER